MQGLAVNKASRAYSQFTLGTQRTTQNHQCGGRCEGGKQYRDPRHSSY